MRRLLAVVLLVSASSSAAAQDLPKATPEGQKAVEKLFRLCVVGGGLKETKAPGKPGPSNYSIADFDRLQATLKAHPELITTESRDALIARWFEVAEPQQSTITVVLGLIGDTSNDDKARAFAVLLYAVRSASRQEFDKAISLNESAALLFKKTADRPWEATCLNNIGGGYDNKGEHDKAIEYYEKALAIRRDVFGDNHPKIAASLNNIGFAFDAKGENDKAIEYYEKALAILRAIHGENHLAVADILNNIGSAYNAKGDHDKAIDYHERVLVIRRAILGDQHPDIAMSLNNIGGAYTHKGEYDKAIEYFEKALAILRGILGDKHPDIAVSLNNIAVAYSHKGDHAKTAGKYRAALRMLTVAENIDPNRTTFKIDELRMLPLTGTVTRLYAAELERGLGPAADQAQLLECVSAYRLASDVIDRLRDKNLESKESKLALGEEYSEMFPDWIGAAARFAKVDGTSNGPIQAFEAAERGTSRVFLEELARRNAKRVGKVDRLMLDAELKIESAIAVAEAKIAIEENKPLKERDLKRLGAFLDERAMLEKDTQELIARMEKAFPMYAALKYPKACTIEQAKACLDENEIALIFVVGRKKSYLVMLRPQAEDKTAGISVHELPSESEIGRMAASLTFPATIKSNALAREKGKQAFNAWLGSVSKEIAGKDLLIVPSGPLGGVPFEMLFETCKDDPEQSVWLVENHRIRYAPSLTILHVINLWDKDGKRPDRTLWALGDPIFDKSDERLTKVAGEPLVARAGVQAKPLPRLIATAKEVQAIDALLHEKNNIVNLADKATKSTLTHASDSGDLKRYRFIHLATHGLLGSKKNDPPALVFGLEPANASSTENECFLRLDEVSRLDLNADLVALSACQTGQGQNRRGEGVTSMARAFLLAGSRDVLCSLWSVDDAKTAELMTTLYSHLNENMGVPDSLRAAQLQMIDRSLPPYYWAAFIASGR